MHSTRACSVCARAPGGTWRFRHHPLPTPPPGCAEHLPCTRPGAGHQEGREGQQDTRCVPAPPQLAGGESRADEEENQGNTNAK